MRDSYVFYEDALSAEYRAAFEQVEVYVLAQNIDESTQEERLGDLLDIFLSAQSAGKPVQSIVGGNIERFCRNFCSDFGVKNRVIHILDWLRPIMWLLFALSAIDLLLYLLNPAERAAADIWHVCSDMNIPAYLFAIVLCGAASIACNAAICHRMFRLKNISMRRLKTAICIEAVASTVAIFCIAQYSIPFFAVPAWAMALASGLYLLLYYPLLGRRNRRAKVTLSEIAHVDLQAELTPVMEKRFEKAKRKSIRKGEGEISFEAFLDQEEKECCRTEKLKRFYIVLPFVATALACAVTYCLEGFETAGDLVIFIAVMMAVESLLLLGLWKIVKHGLKVRKAWVDARREELKKAL